MRIAISATDDRPEAPVHSQFGRCDYFLIFDEASGLVKAVKNAFAETATGAGIGCAQDLAEEGVDAVIAGQFGPKAYEVLNQAGIRLYLSPPDLSAQEAFEKLLRNGLRKMVIQNF